MNGNLTLRCGCTPHQGADLEHVAGCPVIFSNTLLLEYEALGAQMEAVQSLTKKVVEALSLILPEEEE